MTTSAQQTLAWTVRPPAGWSQPRVKDLFIDDTANITVERLSDLEVAHYSIPAFDALAAPAQEHGASIASNKTLLRGGELLFSKLNSHKPRVWLVPSDANTKVASTEFVALRKWHEGKVSMTFARYLLGSAVFAEYISCFQTAVTNSHKRINPEDLLRTHIPLPPLPEQERIAAYLDASCAAIDAAVVAKQEQIKTLVEVRSEAIQRAVTIGIDPAVKMRPSGVEWFHEVPAHWEVDRLKDVVTLRSERTDLASGEEDYLEMEDLESGTGRILNRRNTLEVESAVTLFKRGDVLFGKLRPYLEKYYQAEFDGKCTGEILAFKPVRISSRFLFYSVASRWFIQRCNALAYGAKMPRVSWEKQLSQFLMPLPPPQEQEHIAAYLDAKLAETMRIAASIESQIAALIAYRSSLIHECVTGQRRVTEAVLKREHAHG